MTSQKHHALPPKVQSALTNAYTILVVDDLDANRIIAGRLLQRVGYQTFEAVDGRDAIEKLSGSAPDLVIMDVEMPEMNGIEVTLEFRKLEAEFGEGRLPIIVASGNPTPEMEEAALDAGADIFMTKPFDFNELLRNIRTLLKADKRTQSQKTARLENKETEADRNAANLLPVNITDKNA